MGAPAGLSLEFGEVRWQTRGEKQVELERSLALARRVVSLLAWWVLRAHLRRTPLTFD